ncbi:hypothetical protein ACOMHN_002781 [Nucella lapillus]
MVDFRGFKHSDVPTGAGEVGTSIGKSKKAHIGGFRRAKGGRGGGNKHRGVKKATRNISAIAELTLRESRLLPPLTRSAVDRFFYSLNIPKMVDFRGFKHSDVPTGAGEVGTSIGESKKAHIGGGGLNIRKCSTALP